MTKEKLINQENQSCNIKLLVIINKFKLLIYNNKKKII